MADDIEWELVTKYLRGECDASEAARVERWLERPEVRQALGDALRDVDQRAIAVPRAEVERASDRMRRAIGAAPMRVRASRARHTWLAAAGLVVVATAIGSAMWMRGRGTPDEWHVASTLNGERRRIALGDAGDVVLAPESELRWRSSRRGRSEVVLEGEARFDVRHALGLTVRAHSTITEDIGTSFLITARRNSDGVRVTVMTGAVRLRDTVDATWHRVDAGQRGAVTGRVVRVEAADTTQALAWTRGRLAFVSTPLEQVARELERWFEVKVDVESSVAARRLTGEFGSEPGSLDEILVTISAATDVRHERVDGRVLFRPRR